MSWEDISTDKRACPCGAGYYTVTIRSDDWGRQEERWAMACSKCADAYVLFKRYRIDKGMTGIHFGWVPSPLMDEITRLEKQIERHKGDISSYVKARYGSEWHQHFQGKTKKAIWIELTRGGTVHPKLSTFYSHVKQSGLGQVLDSYLDFHNIQTVISIFGLEDEQLDTMVDLIDELEHQNELRTETACAQTVP